MSRRIVAKEKKKKDIRAHLFRGIGHRSRAHCHFILDLLTVGVGVGVRGMGWRGGPSGVGTPAVFELPDTFTINHRLYFIGDWSVSL